MALESSNGYVAATALQDIAETSLSIFSVERVQLQFSISSDFVAAQVANNVIVLALSNGRILRIDLDNPQDIDDIDLPKKTSEIGVIRRMFLDPTASHLIISTAFGENYYLHTQSRQPKAMSRLKGVPIESIAWNSSLPTASTREILIGAADGNIYETFIEPLETHFRREEKYLKTVYKVQDGAVTGLFADSIPGKPDMRQVIASTAGGTLMHWVGRVGRNSSEGSASIYTRLFDAEEPTTQEASLLGAISSHSRSSSIVISPNPTDQSHEQTIDRSFAWLYTSGVFHGRLISSTTQDLGRKVMDEAKKFPRSQIPESPGARRKSQESIQSIALTQWHVLLLVEGRIVAVNRLNDEVVYDQIALEPGQTALGLVADLAKNTFWLFTSQEIFEILVTNEDRDIWKIMLKSQKFDAALQFAKTPAQKDAVATASGDYLVSKGQYLEAAGIYGKSSKAFEEVCLKFIDQNEQDGLRKYLLTKLSTYKKSFVMQRVMIASWLIEIYMSKLNSLDDMITTKAELSENINQAQSKEQLASVRTEYQEFVSKHKSDIDKKAAYDIISSHGREEELLHLAAAVNDTNYVLAYWVQRERWPEALDVLKRQTDPDIFYKYSSVLMNNVGLGLVDILTRQASLNPRDLIPALLNYNKDTKVPLNQNQAVRYLLFAINQLQSTDAAIHNTLISIYASNPSKDESALLAYLESQPVQEQFYDADFALRLCIQHNRVQSCVHIYSSMGQYLQAVELALKHNEVDLAAIVADRPSSNPALRKKLWLAVAKTVISQSDGIKTAIEFLKRCELLRIEDLIPFFPDFVTIDTFKDEICNALEEYSRHIDALKKEMDESGLTANNIKTDIAALDSRYAIVEPGEKCYICRYPLLSRQFFVFPCQHAFHSDCLGKKVVDAGGLGKGRKIKELEAEVARGVSGTAKRERAIKELDNIIAAACVLCSDIAIKAIDEPFITEADNKSEWAL